MLFTKQLSSSVVLFCTIVICFGSIKSVYADNPSQGTTTDGQRLTINIADMRIDHVAAGSSITVTGQAVISPVASSSYPTAVSPVAIDYVEVRIDSLMPVTATVDELGNWSVITQLKNIGVGRAIATAIATDGTRVTADQIMPCYCDPNAPEPSAPMRFIFLPVVLVK
ncbi:MAG: hypothetical protein DYG89_01080 [Caldilinea sp. CFX5]|nr:hypothetical protein [Caldilinea sp. CFX5]